MSEIAGDAAATGAAVERRGRVYVALVHYPVKGRDGSVITTSVTNLDVHDIARTARTYDIAGYFVVTPIEAQRTLVEHILGYWRDGGGAKRVPERSDALSRAKPIASLEEVYAELGGDPLVLTTAARANLPSTSYEAARARIAAEAPRPALVVFGTGYGLTDGVLSKAHVHLAPVRPGGYNHLPVRCAVAIILDRLLGDG